MNCVWSEGLLTLNCGTYQLITVSLQLNEKVRGAETQQKYGASPDFFLNIRPQNSVPAKIRNTFGPLRNSPEQLFGDKELSSAAFRNRCY